MRKLLSRLGLRFEAPAAERAFVTRFTLDDLPRTRAAMLLGAFIYCAFAVWDWILDPAHWTETLFLRLAVALAVLLPATAALSWPAARRWAEEIYLGYCVVPGCVLSLIYLRLGPGFDHAAAGMIIVILFVSTLLPLRLPSLAAFCGLTWLCFAVCETFAVHERAGMRFVNNFEIGMAYALSLYAVGAREVRARRQFRTEEALRREKERSEMALSELREAQAHLVQAEKLAALGQLVAGVAHEINTPIGLALTTSTAAEGDLRQLQRAVESGQLRRSDLTQGLARLSEGMRLLFSNLTRAADLVHSFKQVAVDQASEEKRTFDLRGWLEDLMSTLGPLVRRKGHAVRIRCEDGIVLDSHPGALAQVISNLALNAIVHGYPDGRSGVLDVAASRSGEDRLRIIVADDGIGIPPEHLGRVFDPFFTTGRDKGSTGLGLHIVFNLVASTLQGQIALSSSEGGGACFTIDLPLSVDEGEVRQAAKPQPVRRATLVSVSGSSGPLAEPDANG
ncbi:integral membrane sensor signal transduction histidine kinase [Methylobacterium sp. 4-46]|uniref:sensor histidine kinase n=1 Tax=unclassified Methylobacterium TaxID=2615210 RepID=UPI000165CB22|nr:MULTISPECIES: HAMP domain-containing sensor histidine kinase [Methylobacterium]ACA19894.1 integral membrane sensor signal transduction histidine kinase [Methylobacterium sp. 4-46]WFT79079.1 HAMP domain-containing sensor histidine kinase [Methylobacterium nodulans]